MRIHKLSIIMLIFLLALPAQAVSARQPDLREPAAPENGWVYLRPGIDWQKFHLTSPRPVDIFVGRLHRGELSATIDSAVAYSTIAGEGPQDVPAMTAEYHDAINYWGYTEPVSNTWVQAWGSRNDVALAINGYFFDVVGGTGIPWSGVVHSGWYAKRFTNNVGDAGFAWNSQRQAFIGSCVYHKGNDFNEALFENDNYSPNIDAVNVPHSDEEFIVYTPQYAASTGTDSTALELLVEMSSPAHLGTADQVPTGILRQISNKGPTSIPFDHVVLSFWGEKRNLIKARIDGETIDEGDLVSIHQDLTDCAGVPNLDWTKTYASLGGDYHFLNGGIYSPPSNTDANVPNSRTVIAFNASYVYFVVVDGWNKNVSEGLKIIELSNFLVSQLGATDAVSMDSGGSSTFVVNGSIVNNTYCNFKRDCGIKATDFGSSAGTDVPSGLQAAPPSPVWEPLVPDACVPGDCKPLVGTSMMLVSVQPISQTQTFTPTQMVTTSASVEVRLGPGSNYASLGSVPAGTQGEIIPDLNGVNGVLATGAYWWRVDMGDLGGWVPENLLIGGATPPPPPPPIVFTDFLFMPTISQAAPVVTSIPSQPEVQRR